MPEKSNRRFLSYLFLGALLLPILGLGCLAPPGDKAAEEDGQDLAQIAEAYIHLVLAVGQHDANYVDAYYGPERWRLAAFKEDFIIPPEKIAEVFATAIAACKERTGRWIDLPEGESFQVEYVTNKPWSGYNWYQGGYNSLIQVNTDLPIFIDRAIDLACHEGYPGHHVYNSLLEKNLVRDRGWLEFSIYPLFSPQPLIAEGTANFGIDMAFPGEEREQFEAATLFPLAGIDPARTASYYRILELSRALRYVDNEAARGYLDGILDAAQAQAFMVRYGSAPERAEQRLRFIETYRSYVINYTLGLDMARAYVDAEAGQDREERWRVFSRLLSSPRLPSDLL